jgi:hypothetical protein
VTTLQSDATLKRLLSLHPKLVDLSLGRMERILAALGHPERHLPPVVHVTGTNGKGSVIAFLRAILEAAGLRVHVYISPHLVHFHERIRLAGNLIGEDHLNAVLDECEAVNGGAEITFFEITTAAAFLAFSRTDADVVLLENGLGQCRAAAGGYGDYAGVDGSPAVPGEFAGRDRDRESRHHQTRRAVYRRSAASGCDGCHRRPYGGARRAAAGVGRELACACERCR